MSKSREHTSLHLATFEASVLLFVSIAGAGEEMASGLGCAGLGAAAAEGFSAAAAGAGGASPFPLAPSGAAAGAAAGVSVFGSGALALSGFFSSFFLLSNFGASEAVGKSAFMVASLRGTRFFFSFRNQLLCPPSYYNELSTREEFEFYVYMLRISKGTICLLFGITPLGSK